MFKVIIVGGGPVGITAGHALYKAGIDFVILERSENVVLDVGAGLVLSASTLRIMRQLRLYDGPMEIGSEILFSKSFLSNGYEFKNTSEWQTYKDNHGLAPYAFHHARLIQTLYDGFPDDAKKRYLANKKVIDIKSGNQGVSVTCSDGSTYDGSIVLGADGVRSKTRTLMRHLAVASYPKLDWDPEDPFTVEYKCMWCSFPRFTAPGDIFATISKDLSVMYITGLERGWIFLYQKYQEPSKERHSYTDQDIEAFAAQFSEYHVTKSLQVKDVFAKRQTFGMADLEEGVIKHWSWGRIVMVGDACHKFTPNAGLGFNNGVQDIVALCNGLHGAVSAAPNGLPDNATLAHVFETYQAARIEDATEDFKQSATLTRLHAWDNGLYYLFSRFILSRNFVANFVMNWIISPRTKKRLVLDYVSSTDLPVGKVAWEREMPSSFD